MITYPWKELIKKVTLLKHFHTSVINHGENVKNKKLRGSSRQWIIRHLEDPYVKLASRKNYRARSAFKLVEIDKKFKIFQLGQNILDCGAAPGSWSQVALERIGTGGKIVAFDINYMDDLNGVICLPFQDINDITLLKKLEKFIVSGTRDTKMESHKKYDVILSDMAPNASGIKSLDHESISQLCKMTHNLCYSLLKNGGSYICKIWDGYLKKDFQSKLCTSFDFVKNFKPDASRDESAESYFICKGFNKELSHDQIFMWNFLSHHLR